MKKNPSYPANPTETFWSHAILFTLKAVLWEKLEVHIQHILCSKPTLPSVSDQIEYKYLPLYSPPVSFWDCLHLHSVSLHMVMEVRLMTEEQGVLTSSSSVSASLMSSELDCNTVNTAWLLSRITNDIVKPSSTKHCPWAPSYSFSFPGL